MTQRQSWSTSKVMPRFFIIQAHLRPVNYLK